MKILITTDWYIPSVNGVVTSVLNLQRELKLRGHDVRVLTLSPTARSYERDGVTYIGSVGIGKLYPGSRVKGIFPGRFLRALLDWQPEVIHSQCEFSTFLLARKLAKKLNIPVIHTYHTVYEDYTHYFSPNKQWGRQAVAFLSRFLLKRTAGVIAPTEKVRGILSGYGIERNIYVIPTGIDLRRFTDGMPAATVPEPGITMSAVTVPVSGITMSAVTVPESAITMPAATEAASAAEKKQALRKKLSIPEGNRVLLYVGRLAKEKNLEELLHYHAACRREGLTFLIVGDGPHREALEQLAAQLGVSDSVRFAGMISPENIGGIYQIGDLFVSASVSETQGLTYMEALASGLPLLCRQDACLAGVILDGCNGWQYRDREDYLTRLKLFLDNPALSENMKKAAADSALRNFSAAAFAEKVEKVYYDTLTGWRPKASPPITELIQRTRRVLRGEA